MSTEKPMIRFFDDGRITIRNARLSYAHLFEPKAFQPGDKPSYSVTAILDKKLHAEAIKQLQAKLLEIQKTELKTKVAAEKLCLRDGDLTGKDEYEGKYILVAREREDNPPALLDSDGRSTVKKSDDKLYSGCFANIQIRLWAQNNNWGKRVNANLLGVQFFKHGDKFSSINRPDAGEMFEEEEVDDDDGFGDDAPF